MALKAAQEVITAALDGEAGHDDCLRYAVDVADHALHGALIRAARDADYMILGGTLHALMAATSPGRPIPWPSIRAATSAVSSPCSRPGPPETGGYVAARVVGAVDAAGQREITTNPG